MSFVQIKTVYAGERRESYKAQGIHKACKVQEAPESESLMIYKHHLHMIQTASFAVKKDSDMGKYL